MKNSQQGFVKHLLFTICVIFIIGLFAILFLYWRTWQALNEARKQSSLTNTTVTNTAIIPPVTIASSTQMSTHQVSKIVNSYNMLPIKYNSELGFSMTLPKTYAIDGHDGNSVLINVPYISPLSSNLPKFPLMSKTIWVVKESGCALINTSQESTQWSTARPVKGGENSYSNERQYTLDKCFHINTHFMTVGQNADSAEKQDLDDLISTFKLM